VPITSSPGAATLSPWTGHVQGGVRRRRGVPWAYHAARLAGTVHVGGDRQEIAATEKMIHAGTMPNRPYVLVCQQYLADPSRSRGDAHPVYTYAHVPSGYRGDATAAIEAQIERFAPGFKDRVLARHVRSVAAMETHNMNYVGGDIVTGSNDPLQLVFRPRAALNPYATGIPGVFICSAATPPGAGAHGMCGYDAARSALAKLTAGRGAWISGSGPGKPVIRRLPEPIREPDVEDHRQPAA
jgi:phytoene dehydrogenase-like protein